MSQWNPDTLNEYLAPNIANFTKFSLEKIITFKESNHWIQNYFLNTVLGYKYKREIKHLVMQCIRRTTHAYQIYNETIDLSHEYIQTNNIYNPKSKLYYNIINNWETVLLNIQMFTDSYNKINTFLKLKKAFTPDDGSTEQRAYDIANAIKHCGMNIDDISIKYNWIPLWIDNDGLVSHNHKLTYNEVRELVIDIAKWTDEFSNPNLRIAQQNDAPEPATNADSASPKS
jgi:hypothetical protein